MKQIITPENIESISKTAAGYKDFLVGQGAELIDESLKYFLFESLLGLVQKLGFFLIVYFVAKIFNIWADSMRGEHENAVAEYEHHREHGIKPDSKYGFLSAYKTRADRRRNELRVVQALKVVVVSGISMMIAYASLDSIRTAGKIIIAPKLFLAEQAAALIKGDKK